MFFKFLWWSIIASTIGLSYVLYYMEEISLHNLDLLSYLMASVPSGNPYPINLTESIHRSRQLRNLQLFYLIEPMIFFRDPALKKIQYEDLQIPVDGGEASIGLRLYPPNQKLKSASPSERRKEKVVTFYHGGGWITGSPASNHVLTAQLAKESGYLVVSVDYRLAPEYIFPTAVNDAYAALDWVIQNVERYGGDSTSIILSGESAGGNLAAAVASRYLANRVGTDSNPQSSKSIIALWLIYPPVSETTFSEEARKHDKVNLLLSIDRLEWMRRLYQGSNETDFTIRSNYLFSPINTPDFVLAHYPPTLFTLAQYDILTAESLEFAEKLRSLKRSVHVSTFKGTIHGFVTGHAYLGPKAVKEAVEYFRRL